MSLRHCPMCEKLFDPEQSTTLPFCSSRCRMADLNRWFDQGYGLPYESTEEDEVRPDEEMEEED